jgi:YebC/PmpR family DNA-binding regulatory protein
MSGHSKWASIKHKKGALDAKRGKVFSRIIKELTVAARASGGDPDMNPRLRTVIADAKAANMPADNIKRAVQKGTGELPGESYEEISYEGYGAGGVAVMIRTLTDNKNRTAPEIRHIFEKNEGRMGTSGCVAWMFDRRGMIEVDAQKVKEDDLLEKALDSGATDVKQVEKVFEVTANPDEMEAVRQALERQGMPVLEARVDMVPQSTVKVEGKEAAAVLRLIEALEEQDDVQAVYSNYDIADEVIDAITAA